MPDYAIARAKYLDEYLAKNKRPIGPLHGLPVSLKDQCRIKVSGYTLLLENPLQSRALRIWKKPADYYSRVSTQQWATPDG